MDNRIISFGTDSWRKLPTKGEEILGLEAGDGAKRDAQKMIDKVDLEIHYPEPKSGIALRNELPMVSKDKKIAELLSYISKIADRTVERLKKVE